MNFCKLFPVPKPCCIHEESFWRAVVHLCDSNVNVDAAICAGPGVVLYAG